MPFQRKKAETFANGAISILNALHVSEICFGSEDGQIENFYNTISVQKNEEETFNRLVKQFMNAGNSYAKATSEAFLHILSSEKKYRHVTTK
ncbi:nucleotidyltransferase family protein [Bacillus paranthracis]